MLNPIKSPLKKNTIESHETPIHIESKSPRNQKIDAGIPELLKGTALVAPLVGLRQLLYIVIVSVIIIVIVIGLISCYNKYGVYIYIYINK